MNIYKLIGRNIDVSDAMRSYAEEKLGKLDRFSDQIVDAKVVMSYAQGNETPARVEVQLNVPNGIVRAEESGQDPYAAVDMVVDKLERQLKRFKGKMMAKRTYDEPPPPPLLPPQDDEPDGDPAIVRTKRHVLRPMTPEDAAVQMEALGHSFFMFHNAESDQINVIYVRQDGNYGLLQPDA